MNINELTSNLSIDDLRAELYEARNKLEKVRNNKVVWDKKRKDMLAEMVHVDSMCEQYFHEEVAAVKETNDLYLKLKQARGK